MLVGFGVNAEDYTWDYFMEHDYYRFRKLIEWKVMPYVMLYNDRQDIPLLRHFRRWVNRSLYLLCNFEDYTRGESQKIISNVKRYT